MGGRLANEIQCDQMSLHESDSASASQTHTLWLFPSQPNLGKRSVGKISWYNYLWWYGFRGQHISEISCKATKTLGFLRRNLAFAPKSTKEVAYNTLVQPKLEYAALIWSPMQHTFGALTRNFRLPGRKCSEDSSPWDLQKMVKYK